VGVVVANPAKVGRDAGEIAGIAATGVKATADGQALLASGGIDAVIYTASADTRPHEAFGELLQCLYAGVNVVSTSFYPLLYPANMPAELRPIIDDACSKGNSSVFVSGIDPGWVMDVLPIMLSGMVADIREVRCQEIFNYALYDQPHVVRNVIGFGGAMEVLPQMLQESSLRMVWEPMVRLIGEGMGRPVDSVEVSVERRPLQRTIQVPGMGQFDAGSQGAFRFEVRGLCDGEVRYVVEHITRIDDDCAADWPYPPEGRGCHRVVISGSPDLHVTVHGEDHHEPGPAGGGNATAANRIVNAVVAVCDAKPGVVTPLDLPPIHGGRQLR
jgi:2,4-diaminopentanoate dehydrogenase